MPNAKQLRDLRRAVDRLSHCAIDDIEWIWSTLDDDQRSRLKPLLSSAREDWKTLLETDTSRAQEQEGAETRDMDGARLLSLVERLPAEVAKRVMASMEEAQRRVITAKLPSARAAAASFSDVTIQMTDRARRSLLAAAYSCASEMAVPGPTGRTTSPRFKRWIGGRR